MTETINGLSQASDLALNNGDRLWQISCIFLAVGVTVLAGMALISILRLPLSWLTPQFSTQTYIRVVVASRNLFLVLLTLSAMEVMLLLIPQREWLSLIEFCLSMGITILSGWMLSRLFREFFNTTILGVTFESNPKVKGE